MAAASALSRAPVALAASVLLTAALIWVSGAVLPESDDGWRIALAAFNAALVAAAAELAGRRWLAVVLATGVFGLTAFAARLAVDPVLLTAAAAVTGLLVDMTPGPVAANVALRRVAGRCAAAAMAALAALIVTGAAFGLVEALSILFAVSIDERVPRFLAALAFGFAPPLALILVAREPVAERVAEALVAAATGFARFLGLPIATLAFAILIAYFARVALAADLPSNEIGRIVAGFGAAGAVVWFLLAGRATPGRAERVFLAAWFPATLPPLALFGFALSLRVGAYGFTGERYIALLVLLTLTALAIAFSLSLLVGAPRDPRLVPITLALILGLGAAGPWSSEPIVLKSQRDHVARLARAPPDDTDALRAACRTLRGLGRLEERAGVAPARSGEEARLAARCEGPIDIAFRSEANRASFAIAGARVIGPFTLWRTEPSAVIDGVRVTMGRSALVVADRGREVRVEVVEALLDGTTASGEPLTLRRDGVTISVREANAAVSERALQTVTAIVALPAE